MVKYDAIVIGSGQAGNPLSHKLADLGWRVALIEKDQLGGSCINYGCTPTKAMVHCAQVAHYARRGAKWGVTASQVDVDLARIVALKDDIVKQFRGGQQGHVDRRPTLDLHRGHARFVASHRIAVGSETIEGERIFINTGTRSAVPAIPGLDKISYLTNASIMELQRLPQHLVVVGGGYIGLEFGQMFSRFGSRVTVVHTGAELLNREDADVAAALRQALEAEGIEFVMNAQTRSVNGADGEVALEIETPQGSKRLSGSHLLLATGRVPNTRELGLELAGVNTDSRGFVKVNDRLETNVPGVWALGDVKGGPAFTHISYNDYQIVYANLIERKNLSTANRPVPYAVFTDPQVGRVGMTETEARAAGYRLKIGKIPMAWVARAIERHETAGIMKIVVNAADDRLLGAAIVSTEAGELIQILGFQMLAGMPYTLMKGAVYIHPTLAEGFWTLMENVKEVVEDIHAVAT